MSVEHLGYIMVRPGRNDAPAKEGKMRLILVIALLVWMLGCKRPPSPPTVEEYQRLIELRSEFITDKIKLIGDCLRVDTQTWDAKNCQARKDELEKRENELRPPAAGDE